VSTTIDERAAWALVRAVAPGSASRSRSVRVELDGGRAGWIEVDRLVPLGG